MIAKSWPTPLRAAGASTSRPFTAFPALLLTSRSSGSPSTSPHAADPAGWRRRQVIHAFGEFVVGGNSSSAASIFLILIVIQFVVITKGAGRVSEVAARFTLDAMPGKQMAIDADLNAGAHRRGEARRRRD